MQNPEKKPIRSRRTVLILCAAAIALVMLVGGTAAWFTFTKSDLNGTIALGYLSFELKVYKENGTEAIRQGSTGADTAYDIVGDMDWGNSTSGRRYIEIQNNGTIDMRAYLTLAISQSGMSDSNLNDFYFRLTDITADVEKSGSLMGYVNSLDSQAPEASTIYGDPKSYMATELTQSLLAGRVNRAKAGYYALDYCCKTVPTLLLSGGTASNTPKIIVNASVTAYQANALVDLGVEQSKSYEVSDWAAFVDAVKSASDGDTVVLTKDITATDAQNITLTRAVRLNLAGHKLEMKGDLRYEHAGSQETWVDIGSGAKLIVGGNFYVNTPDAKFTLIGGTNANALRLGTWDSKTAKVVNGEYYVCSKEYTLDHANVNVLTSSSATKVADMTVGSGTSVVVSPQSEVGLIAASDNAHSIQIYNNGTIRKIDLSKMAQAGYADKQVYIYNAGKVTDSTYQVVLPAWAAGPVTVPNATTAHIINAYGAVQISKVLFVPTFQQVDIENMMPEENVNVIRRAENDYVVIKSEDSQSVSGLMTAYFNSHPEYASEKSTVVSMTFVSANGAHFTSSDQYYVQSMTNLTTLDLTNAVYALKNGYPTIEGSTNAKWQLANLKLPKTDTVLGNEAFTNTQIHYLLMPGSVLSMNGYTFRTFAFDDVEIEWEPSSKMMPDSVLLALTLAGNTQTSRNDFMITVDNSLLLRTLGNAYANTSSDFYYRYGRVFEKYDFYDAQAHCYVRKVAGGKARITKYDGDMVGSVVPKTVRDGTDAYQVAEIGVGAYAYAMRINKTEEKEISLDLSQVTSVGEFAFYCFEYGLERNSKEPINIAEITWNPELSVHTGANSFRRCNVGSMKTFGSGDIAASTFNSCVFLGNVDLKGNYSTCVFSACSFAGNVTLLDGTILNGTFVSESSFLNGSKLICAGHNQFRNNTATNSATFFTSSNTKTICIPSSQDTGTVTVDLRGLQINDGYVFSPSAVKGGTFYLGNAEYVLKNQQDASGFPYNLESMLGYDQNYNSFTIDKLILDALPSNCKITRGYYSISSTRVIREVEITENFETVPSYLLGGTTVAKLTFPENMKPFKVSEYGLAYIRFTGAPEELTTLLDAVFDTDNPNGNPVGSHAFYGSQFPDTLKTLRLPADDRLSANSLASVTMNGIEFLIFTSGNGRAGYFPFYGTSMPNVKSIRMESGTLAFSSERTLPGNMSKLESIVIEDDCKIKSMRFIDTNRSTSFNSVKTFVIGARAEIPEGGFQSLRLGALEEMTLGEDCVLGYQAFSYATFGGINKLTIRCSETSKSNAFEYATFSDLEELIIPGDAVLPYQMFYCTKFYKLTKLTLEPGCTVGQRAFYSATFSELSALSLSNDVKFSDQVFDSATFSKLSSLTISGGGQYSLQAMFSYTKFPMLTELNFTNAAEVPTSLFSNITFSNVQYLDCSNVKTLGQEAFKSCVFPALERLDASGALEIGVKCFGKITSTNLVADFSGVPFIGWGCLQTTQIEKLTLGITEEQLAAVNQKYGTNYQLDDCCFCFSGKSGSNYTSSSSAYGLFGLQNTSVNELILEGNLPSKGYTDMLLGGSSSYSRMYNRIVVKGTCTEIPYRLFYAGSANRTVIENIQFENPEHTPDIGAQAFYRVNLNCSTLELKGSSVGDSAFQEISSGLSKLVLTGTGTERLGSSLISNSSVRTVVINGSFATMMYNLFQYASNLEVVRFTRTDDIQRALKTDSRGEYLNSNELFITQSSQSYYQKAKIYVPAALLEAYKSNYSYSGTVQRFVSDKQFYTNFTDSANCVWNYVFASAGSGKVYLVDMTNPDGVSSIAVPGVITVTGETGDTSYTVVGLAEDIFNSSNLTGVASITLPESVYDFTFAAFDSSVSAIPGIVIPSDSSYFEIQDGTLLSKDGSVLIGVIQSGGSYTVPDTVSGILSGAFRFAQGVSSFLLPNSAAVIPSADRFGGRFASEITDKDSPDSFYFANTGATIHVPENMLSAYATSPYYSGIRFALVGDITRQTDENNVTRIYVGGTELAVDGDLTEAEDIPEDAEVYTSLNAFPAVFSLMNRENEADVSFTDEKGFAYRLNADGTAVITAMPAVSGELVLPVAVTAEENSYTVTGIAAKALKNLQDVTAFALEGESLSFRVDESSALLSADGTIFYRYPAAAEAESYVVPDSVTAVGNYAFAQAQNLKTVTLTSAALRGMGTDVFMACPETLTVVAASSEETTQPDESTEPTQSTEPVEDTEPTEGADPTENTEPTEDKNPTEDTEPTKDTKPAEDAEPTEATEPAGDADAPNPDKTPETAEVNGFRFRMNESGAVLTRIPQNTTGILTIPTRIGVEDKTYTVVEVDSEALRNASGITAFALDGTSRFFAVDERGALLSADRTVLYRYPASNGEESYQIPASVNRIARYAFAQVQNLRQLYMSTAALRGMEGQAFLDCSDKLVVLSGDRVIENVEIFSEFMSKVDPEALKQLQQATNTRGTVRFILDKDFQLNVPYLIGTEEKLTLPTPVQEGYTFEGWYLTADFSGDVVTGLDAAAMQSNLTLYAKWTKTAEKPEETKPEETKSEETKPEETKPEETKPEETEPEDTTPSSETTQAPETTEPETQPTEAAPAETEAAEPAPTAAPETQPVETNPPETQPEPAETAAEPAE